MQIGLVCSVFCCCVFEHAISFAEFVALIFLSKNVVGVSE